MATISIKAFAPEPTDDDNVKEWETTMWGVIIGVSKCKKCGRVSGTSDFDYQAQVQGRD